MENHIPVDMIAVPFTLSISHSPGTKKISPTARPEHRLVIVSRRLFPGRSGIARAVPSRNTRTNPGASPFGLQSRPGAQEPYRPPPEASTRKGESAMNLQQMWSRLLRTCCTTHQCCAGIPVEGLLWRSLAAWDFRRFV